MRHGIVPVLAVVLTAVLASCGGQTAPAAKKIFRIAFSQCNSAEPYRTAQNNIMKRDIAKYPDCQLTIQDAQQDNAKQIAQIDWRAMTSRWSAVTPHTC